MHPSAGSRSSRLRSRPNQPARTSRSSTGSTGWTARKSTAGGRECSAGMPSRIPRTDMFRPNALDKTIRRHSAHSFGIRRFSESGCTNRKNMPLKKLLSQGTPLHRMQPPSILRKEFRLRCAQLGGTLIFVRTPRPARPASASSARSAADRPSGRPPDRKSGSAA